MARARHLKLLLAVLLFTLGVAAILYGIFALVYGGDGSTPTYVTLAGHRLDAHFVGAISVAVGGTLAVCGRVVISTGRDRGLRFGRSH
jgi:hypothetical protein